MLQKLMLHAVSHMHQTADLANYKLGSLGMADVGLWFQGCPRFQALLELSCMHRCLLVSAC